MKHDASGHSGTDLYGKTFACTCGKTHTIEPREVVYGDDALSHLPAVCARATGGRRAAVLMDVRTREVAGAAAVEILSHNQWLVREVVVPDPPPALSAARGSAGGQRSGAPHGGPSLDAGDREGRPYAEPARPSPVCDDHTKVRLAGELGDQDLLVAVGSGVINDLAKWLAWECGAAYVSFATAASMTGYASANVAPTVAGVKTLVHARPPAAVLSSPRALCEAPWEMTAAGLGDALAKTVSSTDWRLNHRLFGDFYCERAVALIGEVEPLYLDRPEALRSGDRAAMAGLFQSLLLTGVSMTMAGSSTPASGGEHLISHALDMMSSLDGCAHDLHGRQVGLGTVLAAAVYERVLALESPRFAAPEDDVDRAFWGRLADEVAAQYAQKRERMRQAAAALSRGQAWDDLRRELAAMVRKPAAVRDCLVRAGAAARAEDILCDRARLLAALGHAHEMRARFTVLDLARLVGVLPAACEELIDQWA